MSEKRTILIFPKRYDISAWEEENGEWSLRYKEEFDPNNPFFEEAVKQTTAFMEMLGYKVTRAGSSLSVELTGSRDEILTILAGEFLLASSLGRMSLAELLVKFAIKAIGESKLSEAIEKLNEGKESTAVPGVTGEIRGESKKEGEETVTLYPQIIGGKEVITIVQEDDGYVAYSKLYPGAVGQGETVADALNDLNEAIKTLKEAMEMMKKE